MILQGESLSYCAAREKKYTIENDVINIKNGNKQIHLVGGVQVIEGLNQDFIEAEPPIERGARYKHEVRLIREKHGDLETIRAKLNLSKRKVCELLLVDPSAWSRWTSQGGEDAPPYIYRSLQWYLSLIDKDVAWHPMNSFLGLIPKRTESMQLQKLKEELHKLQAKVSEHKEGAVAAGPPQSSDELVAIRNLIQKQQDLTSGWKLLVVINLFVLIILVFEQFV